MGRKGLRAKSYPAGDGAAQDKTGQRRKRQTRDRRNRRETDDRSRWRQKHTSRLLADTSTETAT